jgi:hypothetical protein
MSEAVAQIVAQLGSLSQQERADLAYAVLLSLKPIEPGAEEARDRELTRRAERIRSGEVIDTPAEQVFADWRRGRV